MPIIRIDDPQVFVGISLEKAVAQIEEHGYEARLVWADNRTIHTDYKPDYDPLRVNLHALDGKVTKAMIG